MANEFYAFLGRMRYITRWGLMRNSFSENLQEHSHQVAILAHALALIRRDILYLPSPDPEQCAVAALYHDAAEILTGDLPTPIKYYSPELRQAYRVVEDAAGEKLLSMLPPALRESYRDYVLEQNEAVNPIVKAADKLAAYIKCLEELKAGNQEFSTASAQTLAALERAQREEVTWFLENCLEPFTRNLDQLEKP